MTAPLVSEPIATKDWSPPIVRDYRPAMDWAPVDVMHVQRKE